MGRIIKTKDLASKPKRLERESEETLRDLVAARSAANRIRADAKREIIDLALAIAKKIVGKEVLLDSNVLDSIYGQALSAVPESEGAWVVVHPDDRRASTIDDLAARSGFLVVEDPSVGRAGCIIRAGGVEIDATVDTACKALENAMKGKAHE